MFSISLILIRIFFSYFDRFEKLLEMKTVPNHECFNIIQLSLSKTIWKICPITRSCLCLSSFYMTALCQTFFSCRFCFCRNNFHIFNTIQWTLPTEIREDEKKSIQNKSFKWQSKRNIENNYWNISINLKSKIPPVVRR